MQRDHAVQLCTCCICGCTVHMLCLTSSSSSSCGVLLFRHHSKLTRSIACLMVKCSYILRTYSSTPTATQNFPRKDFCSTISTPFEAVAASSPCFSRHSLQHCFHKLIARAFSSSSSFRHNSRHLAELFTFFSCTGCRTWARPIAAR